MYVCTNVMPFLLGVLIPYGTVRYSTGCGYLMGTGLSSQSKAQARTLVSVAPGQVLQMWIRECQRGTNFEDGVPSLGRAMRFVSSW